MFSMKNIVLPPSTDHPVLSPTTRPVLPPPTDSPPKTSTDSPSKTSTPLPVAELRTLSLSTLGSLPSSPPRARYQPRFPSIAEVLDEYTEPVEDVPEVPYEGLTEHHRLHSQTHALTTLMQRPHPFHAPPLFPPTFHPRLILHIDCGTGILTRHLARLFPHARILATEDSPAPMLYAARTPPNVTYLQGTFHALLAAGRLPAEGTVDYIFSQLLILRMTGWSAYVQGASRLLRAGGWMEVQETTATVWRRDAKGACLDAEVTAGWKWLEAVKGAAGRAGLDFDCGDEVMGRMVYAGLEGVQTVGYYEMPFGTWGEEHTWEMGRHMVRWEKEVHQQMMERFLEGAGVRLGPLAMRQLMWETRMYLGAEKGKYRALNVVTGWKRERRGWC